VKCAGLDAEAIAHRSVPPSNLSLLGLVRHLADVGEHWFRRVMAGEEVAARYTSTNVAFDEGTADPAVVADAWATWRAEVAVAERFVAQAPDLEIQSTGNEESDSITLREILIHMIEEYARPHPRADRRPRRPVAGPPRPRPRRVTQKR
jgi:uncharacterized damage-inducible protein DinB